MAWLPLGSMLHRHAQVALSVGEAQPVEVGAVLGEAGIHADLALALGQRVAEHRQAGRVGAALGHADEHRHHQLAELLPQGRCLHQQSNDSTHGCSPSSGYQKNSR
jgi:hypothetical protein